MWTIARPSIFFYYLHTLCMIIYCILNTARAKPRSAQECVISKCNRANYFWIGQGVEIAHTFYYKFSPPIERLGNNQMFIYYQILNMGRLTS